MQLYKIINPEKPNEAASTYVFSLIWRIEGIASLYMLQGKIRNGNWHQIITHSITDSDGEISVNIGDFIKGVTVTIAFGVLAFTNLSGLSVFVTNRTTGETRKLKPAYDETKSIEKSETWDEAFEFETF